MKEHPGHTYTVQGNHGNGWFDDVVNISLLSDAIRIAREKETLNWVYRITTDFGQGLVVVWPRHMATLGDSTPYPTPPYQQEILNREHQRK